MTNIAYYRAKSGMTQNEFAKLMDAGQSTVSQWENGKRTPSVETILKMSKVLGVSPNLLLEENQNNSDWKEINVKPVPEFAEDAFSVPIVASLRCGYNQAGQCVFDVLKKEEVPFSYKKRYGDDIVMVKAVGDSMLPSIRPRDLLICKPGDSWNDGDIVVINVDDSDTIKRIFRAKDGGIDLVPDNSKFKTMHFDLEQLSEYPPHVLGRVVRNYGQDM